ncbi:MAG TPA: tryptophan synthase subunit alpha [Ktedonobacteraceae bacterium]|nr:tryptophan synthase subunit alpha [Ktedonobacteraceae bacterium]
MQTISNNSIPAARITHAFELAKQAGRGVLIPYFMCGFPTTEQSIELVLAAIEGGADIVELGMPFSDPLADGATIQRAGHVALERGMSVNGCMEIARQVTARSHVPLIFMGYYNPLLAYGIERFCREAAAGGICGLIIPDLPPEEAALLQDAARTNGIAVIFLVPPTTADERIKLIVRAAASGPGSFIYCVSLSGVTGARAELPPYLRSFIAKVYGYTKKYGLPLAIGFGLSTPQHIVEVTSYADGAIVGSALVKLIELTPPEKQVEAIKHYIKSLQQGTSGDNHSESDISGRPPGSPLP